MLTYTQDGMSLSVEFDREVFSRYQWRWTFTDVQAARVVATGADLGTAKYDHVGAMRSLLGFLHAFAHTMEHNPDGSGEHADLFPRELWDACGASLLSWTEQAESEMGEEG